MLPGAYPELGSLETVVDHLGVLRAADLVNLDREADAGVPVQARRDPGGRLREPAVRGPRRCSTAASGGISRRPPARRSSASSTSSPTTSGAATTTPASGSTSARAATRPRRSYANTAAIDYYERLVPLLEPEERIVTLLKLAKVLQVVGELGRAEAVAGEARALAEERDDIVQIAWADASLAETAKRQSRFDERDGAARGRARAVPGDRHGRRRRRHAPPGGRDGPAPGDYGEAQARYEDSRRSARGSATGRRGDDGRQPRDPGRVRRRLPAAPASSTTSPSVSATDRRPARDRDRRDERRVLPDPDRRPGQRDATISRRHSACRGARRPGDGRPLDVHPGNAERDLGDHWAAATRYAEALQLQRELDDRFSLTFILEDVGVLLARVDADAGGFELLGGAESVRNQIGSPRPPTLDVELAGHFAAAREAIGDTAAERAVASGRGRSSRPSTPRSGRPLASRALAPADPGRGGAGGWAASRRRPGRRRNERGAGFANTWGVAAPLSRTVHTSAIRLGHSGYPPRAKGPIIATCRPVNGRPLRALFWFPGIGIKTWRISVTVATRSASVPPVRSDAII